MRSIAIMVFLYHSPGYGSELVLPGPGDSPLNDNNNRSGLGAAISSLPENDIILSDLIEKRRRFYFDAFPSMDYVVLKGGDTLLDDIEGLVVLLGHQPVNLDYEHPSDSREDLMYVSLERIRMMLESDTPSASLFLADEPLGWREKLCVLTLHPEQIAANDQVATYFLIESYFEIKGKIKPEHHLDRRAFINFVFDHEVYHCLESDLIGPQPMSYMEFWGDYYHYRHEIGADAFAIAMHIKRHGKVTEFVRSIALIRGLSLYCDDCNHWTSEIIRKVSNMDTDLLTSMSTMDIFSYTSTLRDKYSPSYPEYLVYRSTAQKVCDQISGKLWRAGKEELPEPNPQLMNNMLEIFRESYLDLTGSEFSAE